LHFAIFQLCTEQIEEFFKLGTCLLINGIQITYITMDFFGVHFSHRSCYRLCFFFHCRWSNTKANNFLKKNFL